MVQRRLRVRLQTVLVLLLLALLSNGCAARPVHPGAVNKFDSDAYDALLVTESVIQSTKADLTNNVFPTSIAPNVKDALNYLINSYNVADIAYKAYHSAALAGTVTPVQQANVTTAINQMSNATSTLINAKAGK
jgi:hypothetical protein